MTSFTVNKKGGFLLEALLTVIILSVGLTAVIQAFLSGLRGARMSSGYATALDLADSVMFRVYSAKPFPADGSFPEPFAAYRYKIAATAWPASGSLPSLTEARVSIGWGRDNELALVTCVSAWTEPAK